MKEKISLKPRQVVDTNETSPFFCTIFFIADLPSLSHDPNKKVVYNLFAKAAINIKVKAIFFRYHTNAIFCVSRQMSRISLLP